MLLLFVLFVSLCMSVDTVLSTINAAFEEYRERGKTRISWPAINALITCAFWTWFYYLTH